MWIIRVPDIWITNINKAELHLTGCLKWQSPGKIGIVRLFHDSPIAVSISVWSSLLTVKLILNSRIFTLVRFTDAELLISKHTATQRLDMLTAFFTFCCGFLIFLFLFWLFRISLHSVSESMCSQACPFPRAQHPRKIQELSSHRFDQIQGWSGVSCFHSPSLYEG